VNLDGASALVVGGGSGLGAATTRALAASGTSVYVLDRRPRPVDDAAPIGVVDLLGDVTVADDVRAAVAEANAGANLRLVVNCAGIGSAVRTVNRRGDPHDPAVWLQVLDVNLNGSFHVLSIGAAAMCGNEPTDDGERGVVVLTSSIAAFDGQVGQLAYTASKAAVAGMVLPAARDLAVSGVRVCAIAPGTFDTPLFQTVSPALRTGILADAQFPSRAGRPEEFAKLVQAIAEISYLNAEVFRIDAGARLRPH
jgi:NAD(P)-dependent dehydrogenase (short-subunit alcohol dehydrogenase family)